MQKRFYVTTPIYYINSVPHIGTALTTLAADALTRYERMIGGDPYFLTGTDENGTKIAEAAAKSGKPILEFVSEMADQFESIWKQLHIQYSDFIRTTEERHTTVVQEVFRRLRDAGYIYKGEFEGWYDVSSETFYKESELVDGRSPEGNEVRYVRDPIYKFRLSAFSERLLEHIETHPEFIVPETRRNEVVSFIKQGLLDANVSRPNTGWGIPVPEDESHVIYVWFDALVNYISAIGWPDGDWEKFWPADVQLLGKDILVRFHATLWPAMLMGLGLELPKTLMTHGYILTGGEKISKSKGNVVAPVDLALDLSSRVGICQDLAIDVVRYYSLRTMPYESDWTFTLEDFEQRYNTELVNDVSNGVHRVVSMLHNFCDGKIPHGAINDEVIQQIHSDVDEYSKHMKECRIDSAVAIIIRVANRMNGAIDREKPWELNKNKDSRLADVMHTLVWMVRVLEGICRPITPTLADRIANLLNLEPCEQLDMALNVMNLPSLHPISTPSPIYPRLDLSASKDSISDSSKAFDTDEITIDDFLRVKLKVARVLEAAPVPDADKLLRLELVVGAEKRQVLAGIAQQYRPEELIGRQVILVSNLKPRKLRGIESQGMILAADGPNGEAILLQPDKEAPDGTNVH
jgi:methionyl-tRNA synthetase